MGWRQLHNVKKAQGLRKRSGVSWCSLRILNELVVWRRCCLLDGTGPREGTQVAGGRAIRSSAPRHAFSSEAYPLDISN